MIRRTLFTCGRVNPIAPSIAGRRREYQRSKRARLFRREYFKQSSSNFQIYLCKECPSRPAVSRSRNSKAHRRRISAVFSALLFIRFSKVRYPHRTFRNDANFEYASGFVKTSATWKSVPIPANSMSPLFPRTQCAYAHGVICTAVKMPREPYLRRMSALSRRICSYGTQSPQRRVGGYRDTDSLFWLWAKANKQRLDLLLCLWAAAAAADQPSFRGKPPLDLVLVSKQGARRAARAPCRGEGRRAVRQAKISSETVARNKRRRYPIP